MGEAVATGPIAVEMGRGRPQGIADGETILWQGKPAMLSRKLAELAGFLLLLTLLSILAVELIIPHFGGSTFAGNPQGNTWPLILTMLVGMFLIIATPVWLRSSARARARYMLTNRRALIWLGNRIIGEALLFGADMRVSEDEVNFVADYMVISWRLKDEGPDRLRFERIAADVREVAALAEKHGARWIDPPAGSDPAAGPSPASQDSGG